MLNSFLVDLELCQFKGTVMQTAKAPIKDCLRVSKVS